MIDFYLAILTFLAIGVAIRYVCTLILWREAVGNVKNVTYFSQLDTERKNAAKYAYRLKFDLILIPTALLWPLMLPFGIYRVFCYLAEDYRKSLNGEL